MMRARRYDIVPSMMTAAVFLSVVVLCADAKGSEASTLWAAAGERAAQGGSLIAKNRDWVPEPQEVRLVNSGKGLRFLGLYPIRDGKRRSAVAGINEKGLVVVTASAGSVPAAERVKGGSGLTRKVLSEFSTAEAVLAGKALFTRTHPAMYLIADRQRIAWIEVAPQGRIAVRIIENGVLAHTNHYLDEVLVGANASIGRSSRTRLARIGELLNNRTAPLTLEEFIGFSQDRNDGPDNSLWRTGSTPVRERTLASWIVSLPKENPPELFCRLANPSAAEKQVRIRLDASFWEKRDGLIF